MTLSRFITVAGVSLSVFTSLCILLPAPVLPLLPLTLAAPELSSWLIVFDLFVLVLAFLFLRRAVPFILVVLLIAALVPVTRGHFSLSGIDTGHISPERLPTGILYYKPAGNGPHPALIDIYGGAWQRGTPASDDNFNSFMASRGYAVFAIDYRHAPEFKYPAQIDDVRAALKFIYGNAPRYNADPARFFLSGRSAGGQLALLAAYAPGGIPVRGVVAFYAPVDLAAGYNDPPFPDPLNVRSVLEAYLGGTPGQVPNRYTEASPATYSSLRLPPTLLIQGQRDHIVKPRFAREFYMKSLAAGNRVELLEIPWAEHAFDLVFSGSGNQMALNAISRFLQGI